MSYRTLRSEKFAGDTKPASLFGAMPNAWVCPHHTSIASRVARPGAMSNGGEAMSKKITGMAEVPSTKRARTLYSRGVNEPITLQVEKNLKALRYHLMDWAYFRGADKASVKEAKRRLRMLAERWKRIFGGPLKVTLSKPPPKRKLELIRSEAMHRAIKDGFRPPRRDVKNTKYKIVYDRDGRVDSVKVSVLNGTSTLVTYLASYTDDRLVLRKHMSLDD